MFNGTIAYMCKYHRVIYRLILHVHVPTYLLALPDFRHLFNSPSYATFSFELINQKFSAGENGKVKTIEGNPGRVP